MIYITLGQIVDLGLNKALFELCRISDECVGIIKDLENGDFGISIIDFSRVANHAIDNKFITLEQLKLNLRTVFKEN